MTLQRVILELDGSANGAVIWLHGLGADGHDFVPVVEMLGLSHLRFILPHAPYQAVTLNNGYEMRAWYDILGLQDDSPQDVVGLSAMRMQIEALIEGEMHKGIPAHRIVLAGFSQGGALALYTATRSATQLAGVLALSTYLPCRSSLESEMQAARTGTPILMTHGRYDTVISPATAAIGKDALLMAGFNVDWRLYDMPHSVCDDEIDDIRQFLLKVVPA